MRGTTAVPASIRDQALAPEEIPDTARRRPGGMGPTPLEKRMRSYMGDVSLHGMAPPVGAKR
jgi:hypothetical protein